MKLRPTLISFVLRYFIFVYFIILSISSIAIKDSMEFGWYLLFWVLMTMVQAFFHSFRRARFGWIFWTALLDFMAFSPRIEGIYHYMETLSNNPSYLHFIGFFREIPEVKIFTIVSLIGILITQLYRLSFRYEVNKNGIFLKSGIFSRKERIVLGNHITDIFVTSGFFQRIFSIGNIIPITSSGFGGGENTVFGGGAVRSANAGGFVGKATSQKVEMNDPAYVIYGVKDPERLKDTVLDFIEAVKGEGELNEDRPK